MYTLPWEKARFFILLFFPKFLFLVTYPQVSLTLEECFDRLPCCGKILNDVLFQHGRFNDSWRKFSIRKCIFFTLVWGYAIAAIAIISLSSLMVIVVIPLLGKSFYNKLMSFLVALAIGCLAGDALLHLIPHVCMFVTAAINFKK